MGCSLGGAGSEASTFTQASSAEVTAGTDRLRGNNLLRGLIADHYTQNVAGRRAEPVVYASVHGTVGFHDSAESVVTSVAEAIARRDLAVDYVQVDAGLVPVACRQARHGRLGLVVRELDPGPGAVPQRHAGGGRRRARPQVHPVVRARAGDGRH